MQKNSYLVTGSLGCIGAWVLTHLAQQHKDVVSFDLSHGRHRLDALLTPEQQNAITFVQGDVTDFEQVTHAIEAHQVTHIIHLAALQVPFCRANPVRGSQVNITGTFNIFEAAKNAGIRHLTYASSIAVYGRADEYPPGLIAAEDLPLPHTIYGVTKVANEGTARIYWQDHSISSIALRPYTIYGVGRDQGLTSDPTKAMLAAVKNEPFEIGFSGPMQFHFASDTALQFISAAEQTDFAAAAVYNLGTPVTTVAQFIAHIKAIKPDANITQLAVYLPFPPGCDDTPLRAAVPTVYETPLAAGIADTMAHFEKLEQLNKTESS